VPNVKYSIFPNAFAGEYMNCTFPEFWCTLVYNSHKSFKPGNNSSKIKDQDISEDVIGLS
jgi:hypothetical protein